MAVDWPDQIYLSAMEGLPAQRILHYRSESCTAGRYVKTSRYCRIRDMDWIDGDPEVRGPTVRPGHGERIEKCCNENRTNDAEAGERDRSGRCSTVGWFGLRWRRER